MGEFGNYGSTRTILYQLVKDKIITRPRRGLWSYNHD